MVVTTTGFTNIAKAVGKAEGVAGLRVAEYPGAVGVHPEALVEENVEKVLFKPGQDPHMNQVPESAS